MNAAFAWSDDRSVDWERFPPGKPAQNAFFAESFDWRSRDQVLNQTQPRSSRRAQEILRTGRVDAPEVAFDARYAGGAGRIGSVRLQTAAGAAGSVFVDRGQEVGVAAGRCGVDADMTLQNAAL